ncbi:MAG: hypothetical protein ABH879_04125 [archaeon]
MVERIVGTVFGENLGGKTFKGDLYKVIHDDETDETKLVRVASVTTSTDLGRADCKLEFQVLDSDGTVIAERTVEGTYHSHMDAIDQSFDTFVDFAVIDSPEEITMATFKGTHPGLNHLYQMEVTADYVKGFLDHGLLLPHNIFYGNTMRQQMEAKPWMKIYTRNEPLTHAGMADHVTIMSLPLAIQKRYGFQKVAYHGAAYESVAEQLPGALRDLGLESILKNETVIAIHAALGSSLSLALREYTMDGDSFATQILNGVGITGRTIDSTFGMGASEGLIQCQRLSGDVPPDSFEYLVQRMTDDFINNNPDTVAPWREGITNLSETWQQCKQAVDEYFEKIINRPDADWSMQEEEIPANQLDTYLARLIVEKHVRNRAMKMITKESGMQGMSANPESQGNLRDIYNAAERDDVNSRRALDAWYHRARYHIGGLKAVAGAPLDVVTLSAGTGEKGIEMRAALFSGMSHEGFEIDTVKNNTQSTEPYLITTPESTPIIVITARENDIVARDCWNAYQSKYEGGRFFVK